jgi:hypothetical protein
VRRFAGTLGVAAALAGCAGTSQTPPAASTHASSAHRHARAIFVGNYQTGSISQWPAHEFPPGGIVVGRHLAPAAPPAPYRFVAKFTIGVGGPAARRSEVHDKGLPPDGREGVDDWWRWYMLFPRGFRGPPNGDMLLSDWHQQGGDCAPPVTFLTHNGVSLYVKIRAGATKIRHWSKGTHFPPLDPGYQGRIFQNGFSDCEFQSFRNAPVIRHIRPNHWYQVVVHARWSSTPADGRFDVWIDGCRRTRGSIATLMPPAQFGSAFFKQGIYDPHDWPAGSPPDSVFFTGTTAYAARPNKLSCHR